MPAKGWAPRLASRGGVLRLPEEKEDALGDLGPDVFNLGELLGRGRDQGVESPEMAGQGLGQTLADVADSQGKNESRQVPVLGVFDLGQQVLRTLRPHSLQGH